MSRNVPYLDYLRALMPQQRRDAIFHLAELTWGMDNPKFLDHPRLADELAKLGIWNLGLADKCQEVGPVEFNGGRCTVPLTYPLYEEGELSTYEEDGLGYFVEVHILARVANNPGAAVGDVSIRRYGGIESCWTLTLSKRRSRRPGRFVQSLTALQAMPDLSRRKTHS
jgi:hypothetical protein